MTTPVVLTFRLCRIVTFGLREKVDSFLQHLSRQLASDLVQQTRRHVSTHNLLHQFLWFKLHQSTQHNLLAFLLRVWRRCRWFTRSCNADFTCLTVARTSRRPCWLDRSRGRLVCCRLFTILQQTDSQTVKKLPPSQCCVLGWEFWVESITGHMQFLRKSKSTTITLASSLIQNLRIPKKFYAD